MTKKISRRDFLKVLAAAVGAGVAGSSHWMRQALSGWAQDLETKLYLPLVNKAKTSTPKPPETTGRVVHVHSHDATFWNTSDHRFWNYVNQQVVDEMVDQGLMALTGQSSVKDAWHTLLPDYQVGYEIAVKVNFNNSSACNDIDHQIDALIQPINAVVRGLKQIGVVESDIWIYDAIRRIPDRFVAGSVYGGIQYFDSGCRNWAGFNTNTYITFNPPPGVTIPPIRITDVLVNAKYLINIPIMKGHSLTGATVSFKNHFGSINSPSSLHDTVGLNRSSYRSDYSPFVDLYNSPHICDKTILTMGDGLFAAKQLSHAPQTWASFGNQVPNSLYFATDPVAADCVMFDFIDAEINLPPSSYDFLRLAWEAGLGIYERGDPWGSGYSLIDYHRINL